MSIAAAGATTPPSILTRQAGLFVVTGMVGTVLGLAGSAIAFTAGHRMVGAAAIGVALLGATAMVAGISAPPDPNTPMPELSQTGRFHLTQAAIEGHVSLQDAQATLNDVWKLNLQQPDSRMLSTTGSIDLGLTAVQANVSAQSAFTTLNDISELNATQHLDLTRTGEFHLAESAIRGHVSAQQAASTLQAAQ